MINDLLEVSKIDAFLIVQLMICDRRVVSAICAQSINLHLVGRRLMVR
jgi:hypothetical protein